MKKSTKYSAEVMGRGVRWVFAAQVRYASEWPVSVFLAAKTGGTAETLRRQARCGFDAPHGVADFTSLSAWRGFVSVLLTSNRPLHPCPPSRTCHP